MAEDEKFEQPLMVAVWPGMGNVAINAGYYLMSKLGMRFLSELSARELFEVEHIEVKEGMIHAARLPRSRFFLWKNPAGGRDLIVFLGEAQPPIGKNAFCRKIIEYAKELEVEQIFTFAAMATKMHPEHDSRVFCAATDDDLLGELKEMNLELIEDGHIGGLNGVLLGAAAEGGMRGACLLGEMPHIFSQLPFPKASLAVLEVFAKIAGIELDFTELSREAEIAEERLGDLLAKVEEAIREGKEEGGGESYGVVPEAEEEEEKPAVGSKVEARIEELFAKAKDDRSRAYELKQELDRYHLFPKYEDRFLDLFREEG